MSDPAVDRLAPPSSWYARVSPPTASGEMAGASLCCFDGTDPTIDQPALDENVIAIHLGGPKRVERWQGRSHASWNVPLHAVTLMPAFRANRWRTEGVVGFAHLTVGAPLLARLAREEFDREPGGLLLLDRVGLVDPLLSELMLALCREVSAPGMRRLYRDTLLTTLALSVLRKYATLHVGEDACPAGPYRHRGGLAGWQLRRVTDFLEANAMRDLALDEVVRLTGLSRAQFFRAFRRSTGETPARYLQQLRMRNAAVLLGEGGTVGEAAARTGYVSCSHFASVFRRYNGTNPGEWQRLRRGRLAGLGGGLVADPDPG